MSAKGVVVSLFLTAMAANVYSQSSASADAVQRRLARARALAAAHNLAAATSELDAIINAATDEMERDVARIMLVGIYLEEADYPRANSLLTKTFEALSPQNESSIRSYFALAGQTVKGARARLERYRSYGINIADKDLPPDAINDLNRLRLLLELVADQARGLSEGATKGTDAVALLEDVVSVRTLMARDEPDRLRWQREFESTREKLAASETRIAALDSARAHQTPIPLSSSVDGIRNAAPVSSAQPSTPDNSGTLTKTGADPNAPDAQSARQSATYGDAQKGGETGDGHHVIAGSLLEKAMQKVTPTYPPTAKSAGITGMVTLYLEVDETGTVSAVFPTSGPQLLRQAAIDAARRWKFKPAVVEGQPVRMTGYLSFNFTL